jgi:hypothetical protein
MKKALAAICHHIYVSCPHPQFSISIPLEEDHLLQKDYAKQMKGGFQFLPPIKTLLDNI